jgi:hypothetical protein
MSHGKKERQVTRGRVGRVVLRVNLVAGPTKPLVIYKGLPMVAPKPVFSPYKIQKILEYRFLAGF